MLQDSQMSNIYFHTDITLFDGSNLQGGEWQVYPDTPEAGAAT